MRARLLLTSLVLGATTMVSSATIAQAAPRAPEAAASAPSAAGASRWIDTTQEYFWRSDCETAGRAAVQRGFVAYDCRGGGLFSYYRLWVKTNN